VDNLLDSGDDVERAFKEYLQRSGDAAKVAQRRPNALLFAGTIIALVGLVFIRYRSAGCCSTASRNTAKNSYACLYTSSCRFFPPPVSVVYGRVPVL
jgi:hypothetical protein